VFLTSSCLLAYRHVQPNRPPSSALATLLRLPLFLSLSRRHSRRPLGPLHLRSRPQPASSRTARRPCSPSGSRNFIKRDKWDQRTYEPAERGRSDTWRESEACVGVEPFGESLSLRFVFLPRRRPEDLSVELVLCPSYTAVTIILIGINIFSQLAFFPSLSSSCLPSRPSPDAPSLIRYRRILIG
jgi:hypothetical protein